MGTEGLGPETVQAESMNQCRLGSQVLLLFVGIFKTRVDLCSQVKTHRTFSSGLSNKWGWILLLSFEI